MSLIPNKNTPDKDIVMTPIPLAKAIIQHLPIEGKVLDPCRGEGAFYDNLPGDVDYCELSEGLDFFDYKKKVDWIVSNPPWSKYRAFCNHAYTIADNVAFLITINHDLSLKARLRDMNEAGFGIKKVLLVDTPKDNWPQSGFQLGVCWKQKGYEGPTDFINI